MAAYAINAQFNGIEVTFDKKPSAAILEALKTNGFRWHSTKKLWYAKNTTERLSLAESITSGTLPKAKEKASKKTSDKVKEKVNKYGVKVGDLFSASWGYDQTNTNFFQVIELVGETSVRVREVYPPMIEESPTCSMAANRTYKNTKELLPASSYSVFIKDQEKGDLKRLRPGYHSDPEEAKKNCAFYLSSFCDAHKVNGDSITMYESWYR